MPFMVILWVVSSLGLGKISPGSEERTAIILGAVNAPQTAVLAKLQDSWAVLMEQVRLTLKNSNQEQRRWDRIYNACILDKSAEVDMSVGMVVRAVNESCEAVADNPSWLQKLRYD